MSNLSQLIKNEFIKLHHYKSTWAMYIILAILLIASALITNFVVDQSMMINQTFQGELMQAYQSMGLEVPAYDMWAFVAENISYISFITIFIIVVAAKIISNEYKWGTIKLLLIRPAGRGTVLASKYITVLLFAVVLILYTIVLSLLIGLIFFGVDAWNPTIVDNMGSGYTEVSIIASIGKDILFQLVPLIIVATLSFMIAILFKGSAMAIAASIVIYIAAPIITMMVSQYEIAKYLLTAHLNLQEIFEGTPIIEGTSLGFSIAVLLVYYIVFMAAGWLTFKKRDVAGN
ncbi:MULTISPECIES: ABC transporter permease subunit [Oceanobacillus]|uniref:ABC transporter permease subunit n=1 Tax=Oceanobacillus aidingensis TaxID=645964 RepID=A0ABV9K016_9BACI|nr:ABC transporter permease subunit [Oceanobacillus oncorhynchi]MDM8099526.1 ABC transporter permease subunit [Oceanobacillus oncorhynchi]UUI42015.1 ABC transporter permease [Oceanobacillus oncorhynchi]